MNGTGGLLRISICCISDLTNSRLPIIDDIMLFAFNDSEYGKGGTDWRLGKITAVKGTQVSVTYSVLRSARDISILHSNRDLLVNTREHFSALRAYEDYQL